MQLHISSLRVRRNAIHRCEYRLSLFWTHAVTGSRSRRHTIETVICDHGLGMYRLDAKGVVMVRSIYRHAAGLFMFSVLAASAALAQNGNKAPDYEAIVASPDRSDADRQTDQRRDPAKMLAFVGVATGMKVLDMGAEAGYSSELMARAVGPTGMVYAQDSAAVMKRVKDKFDIRAKSP